MDMQVNRLRLFYAALIVAALLPFFSLAQVNTVDYGKNLTPLATPVVLLRTGRNLVPRVRHTLLSFARFSSELGSLSPS